MSRSVAAAHIAHFLPLLAASLWLSSATEAVEPWAKNPWYWSHQGQPVLLLGGSDDDNLFQWPQEQLIPQLDRISAAGGNVIRNTMSDRKDRGFEVYPFRQRTDGRYDLKEWNPEYWSRFETLLRETQQRGIFVQIEVWDRFDYTDARQQDRHRWEHHPYNPAMNVNYSFKESGFARRYPDHPGTNRQPFFFTTPKQRNNTVVLQYQQAFVNRLLDASLKYDHVLYCMDNETSAEPQWGQYWARFIRQRASADGHTVMLTEMWDDWNLRAARHRQTFDHPDLYGFVDVSQNNHNKGQKHWNNFLFVRNYLAKHPRPVNTIKTYGADGNKFGHNDQDAIERFWRHLLAGAAAIRFHRPDSGLGISDKAVVCLKAARLAEQQVALWNLQPATQLLQNRAANEAYLAADTDQTQFLLYFPSAAGERQVQLPASAVGRSGQWIHIDTGRAGSSFAAESRISPPAAGNWAAVLK